MEIFYAYISYALERYRKKLHSLSLYDLSYDLSGPTTPLVTRMGGRVMRFSAKCVFLSV